MEATLTHTPTLTEMDVIRLRDVYETLRTLKGRYASETYINQWAEAVTSDRARSAVACARVAEAGDQAFDAFNNLLTTIIVYANDARAENVR